MLLKESKSFPLFLASCFHFEPIFCTPLPQGLTYVGIMNDGKLMVEGLYHGWLGGELSLDQHLLGAFKGLCVPKVATTIPVPHVVFLQCDAERQDLHSRLLNLGALMALVIVTLWNFQYQVIKSEAPCA